MKTFIIIMAILLVLLIIFLVESHREINLVKKTYYEISSSKLPDELGNKKFVFISDYHNACDGRNNQKIFDLIDEEKPFAVLCGGDMVIGRKGMTTAPALDMVKMISEKYPFIYAKGNHESRIEMNKDEKYGTMWKEYVEGLDALKQNGADIRMVDDEHVRLVFGDKAINVYGVSLDRKYYQRFKTCEMREEYLEDKIGICDESEFNILMAHDPDYYEAYARWGADLSLTGHFHGGIVRLPILGGVISARLRIFPRYDKGLYNSKNYPGKMILTSGLGQHSIKVRFNNIPEVVVVTLVKR